MISNLSKFLGTSQHLTFQNLYKDSLIFFKPHCGLFTFVYNSSTKLESGYNNNHITFIPLPIFQTIYSSQHKESYPKKWLGNVITFSLTIQKSLVHKHVSFDHHNDNDDDDIKDNTLKIENIVLPTTLLSLNKTTSILRNNSNIIMTNCFMTSGSENNSNI